MKITVKHLGAVQQAEVELKPLTVFVGHNSTGKTWTAYALASIFSDYGYKKYLENYLEGKTRQTYPVLDTAIEKFFQEGSAEINIVQFVKENVQYYFNDVALLTPCWMRDYLSTKRVEFDDSRLQIDLNDIELLKIIKELQLAPFNVTVATSARNLSLYKEEGSEIVFFNTESRKKEVSSLPQKFVSRFIYRGIFEILHKALYPFVHLFPIERSAFISLPVIEKIEAIDNITHFSQPIWNLVKMIEDVSSISLDSREEQKNEMPQIQDFMDLAVFLEEQVLRGKGGFEESGVAKELLFYTEELKLELGVTSSMTKELMALVLYLRYLARPNDLIVIDEPEMNLHPAAQIEIIEFLAMLVNAGLNVLITTHSPYIVDHISNLMEAAKHENKEEIKEYFYLENTNAFIPQDKVSVYLFEDGTAKNILRDDASINWETFWNVSSDISGIYGQLLKNRKD